MSARDVGISEILQAFDPSPTILLDLLRARVDDAMLQEIAAADWGTDVEEHLSPLLRARDFGEVPPPDWYPREVLNLTKWSDPEDAEFTSRDCRERAHIERAFACTILLRMAAEPTGLADLEREENAVGRLAASALSLGPETTEAAVGLLAWRISRVKVDNWDRLPFELGLLLSLAARQPEPSPSSPSRIELMLRLADWIIAELPHLEASFRDALPGESLLESAFHASQTADTWHRLICEILLESPWPRPEVLQEKLVEVGRLVFPNQDL